MKAAPVNPMDRLAKILAAHPQCKSFVSRSRETREIIGRAQHFDAKGCVFINPHSICHIQQYTNVGNWKKVYDVEDDEDEGPYVYAVVKHEACRADIARALFPVLSFLQERLMIDGLQLSEGCLIHGPDVSDNESATLTGYCAACFAGNLKKAQELSYKRWLVRQSGGLLVEVWDVVIDWLIRA
jgi:hypothetical protein